MSESNFPLTFPVDAEHGGFRVAVVVIFVVAVVGGYVLANYFIPSEGVNLIAGLIGFGLAYIASELAERFLKKRWRSGRVVEADPEGIRLVARGKTEQTINSNQPIEVLTWRFPIKRRTRIPKGWFMVACALQQDERCLPVYSFISPTQFETWQNHERFTLLIGKKELEKRSGSSGRDDLRLAGEQRRLMSAENIRWMEGAEMTLSDFETYLHLLETRFPEWTPLR
jgi:hypothetical protein